LNWLYRISFYHRLQATLLLFLIIPLLLISGFSYLTNKQANEENVRSNMKGILGILANDLSKTANDVTYTVNQYTAFQPNGIFNNLKSLKNLNGFENFRNYREYSSLNENSTILIGKLSLVRASVFFVNRNYYPIVGSLNSNEIALLRDDNRFDHMSETDAASGIVEWFRAEKSNGYGSVLGEDFYFFIKKTVYDPLRDEVIGSLFIGIPESYFDGLFRKGEGVFSLYTEDGTLIAGVDGSPEQLNNGTKKGWIREQTKVSGTPWSLTYDIDKDAVTGDLTQRYSFILMAVLIVLFVFLFISVVLARGLNRPIQKLMRIAIQYGEGNSSIRYNIKGNDEISMLGNTINDMLDNINSLIRKVEAEQEEKRTIELNALFSQIQPHFLLNTLNSIKCNLALEGDQVHSETIDSLMGLLRAYLRVHEPLPLAEECKLLTHYVSIMRMRNRLTIDFEVDLPERYDTISVPRLLLQPLVENSIVHGFSRQSIRPCILVSVGEVEGGVEIRVQDNGKGMSGEQVEALNRKLSSGAEHQGERGIGLHNVMRRLKLSYGDKATFTVSSNHPAGFVSILFIPMNDIDREGNRYD